jgi:hypothetical protein
MGRHYLCYCTVQQLDLHSHTGTDHNSLSAAAAVFVSVYRKLEAVHSTQQNTTTEQTTTTTTTYYYYKKIHI